MTDLPTPSDEPALDVEDAGDATPELAEGADVAPPDTAPTDADEPPEVVFARTPEPLHPKIRIAWLIEELIGTVILGSIAAGIDFFWLSKHADWWPLPRGLLFALAVIALLIWAVVSPKLSYRHWRYAVRDHDVLTSSGILWRTQRSVPRLRIQHVELQTGPITRRLGLVTVTFFTAGTGAADAKIPGLRPDVAEAIRDRLLKHDLPTLAAREAENTENDDANAPKAKPRARVAKGARDMEGQMMLFSGRPTLDES